ncbi:MAG: hypothetical protein AB8G05_06145 [Oligoflexales bacterium]
MRKVVFKRLLFWVLLILLLIIKEENLLASHYNSFGLRFGLGLAQVTQGIQTPQVNGIYTLDGLGLSMSSVGFRNDYMYFSSQVFSLLWGWRFGSYLWGDLEGGFGPSIMNSERGFYDSQDHEEKAVDYSFGVCFRLDWFILDPFFLGVSNHYGTFPQHALVTLGDILNFDIQYVTSFQLGTRF